MSLLITRTVQVIALVVTILAFMLMFSYFRASDMDAARQAGATMAVALIIFLLTAIIRLLSDLGEAVVKKLRD